MKNKFTIAVAITALFVTSNSLRAQSAMAYVSRDSIMKSVPGYLERIKQVDEITKAYSEELKEKRENLTKRFASLLQPYNIKQNEKETEIRARMSSVDTTSLGMLQQEEKLIAATDKLYAAKVKSTYEKEVLPVNEKIMATIRRCAVKNKVDMVFFIEDISPALAYINTKRSLTKEIIKEIAITR